MPMLPWAISTGNMSKQRKNRKFIQFQTNHNKTNKSRYGVLFTGITEKLDVTNNIFQNERTLS